MSKITSLHIQQMNENDLIDLAFEKTTRDILLFEKATFFKSQSADCTSIQKFQYIRRYTYPETLGIANGEDEKHSDNIWSF